MENKANILSSVKYCYECKTNKNIVDFDININGQFGRYPICKSCRSIKRKIINNESIKQGYKLCLKCNLEKEVLLFDKDKSQNDGLQSYCKECRRTISKNWASTLDGFIKKILSDLNIYCKKNHIINTLNLDNVKELYIKQNGLCKLTGLPLTHLAYSNKDNNEISEFFNISIDRIEANKEFEINNIQLIGSMIKKMKGNMTNEKFIEFCKMVLY